MAAASVPPLKISVLHYQPSGDPMDPVVEDVMAALKSLGHVTTPMAVHDRVFDLLQQIEKQKPDLVFNVCETFADDYRLEVNVAAVLEMARVNFTGSGTAGLLLAQDKILTKQLLEYHEVNTPNFLTFDGEAFEAFGRMNFPLIVKPARSDASIGIGQHSVVKDWDELTRRVREIRKTLNDEALAEEFIDGREVYVGVIGPSQRPEILPIVELDWGQWNPDLPKVSDREVKFGDGSEHSPHLVIAEQISPELKARIERSALLAYRALKIRDYARVDFRISNKTGEPFVLEVNPNPYLEKDSELGMAAESRGLSYPQLIATILESAASRYGLKVKGEKTTSGEVPAVELRP
ncbi:MAG: ATP-grasp domain-containing protein [Myxococcaceae bacterium]